MPGGEGWGKISRGYIKHIVKHDEYYPAPFMRSETRDDGEVASVEEDTFFQVHVTMDGSSRLKQVKTSFDDAGLHSHDESALVILVQYMDAWSRGSEVVHAYLDADPLTDTCRGSLTHPTPRYKPTLTTARIPAATYNVMHNICFSIIDNFGITVIYNS